MENGGKGVFFSTHITSDLDKIAEGDLVWNKVLQEFYDLFEPRVLNAFDAMEKKAPQETGEVCPECGNPLVIRNGRYGAFTACSNYPECKYIKKEDVEQIEVMPCPLCDGTIIEKKTRKGKVFYGCDHYPKCKFASWDKPLEENCTECGNYLVEHKDKIKCSKCDYSKED